MCSLRRHDRVHGALNFLDRFSPRRTHYSHLLHVEVLRLLDGDSDAEDRPALELTR